MTVSFVHLRLHTEFSLVDGLVRVKPLAKAVAGLGMPAVAVTDQSNMCSLVKFYKTAMGAGIKPICGADIWLASREEDGPLSRLSLLAMNAKGYRNLTELISRGWSEGQRNGEIIIERDWVKEAAEGLIALSAAKEGEIGHACSTARKPRPRRCCASGWRCSPSASTSKCNVPAGSTTRSTSTRRWLWRHAATRRWWRPTTCASSSRKTSRPTRPASASARADPRRPRRPRTYSDQQYLKSPAEMAELFSDLPEALENTVEIAKRCNIEVQLGKYFLPDFPTPNGMGIDDYLRHASFEGLEERLEVLLPKDTPDYEAKRQVYVDRLNFELDIIIQMGFPVTSSS